MKKKTSLVLLHHFSFLILSHQDFNIVIEVQLKGGELLQFRLNHKGSFQHHTWTLLWLLIVRKDAGEQQFLSSGPCLFMFSHVAFFFNKEPTVLSCKKCPLSDRECHLLPDHYWSPLFLDCSEETDGWDLQLLPPAPCYYLRNTPDNWQDACLKHSPKPHPLTTEQVKCIKNKV